MNPIGYAAFAILSTVHLASCAPREVPARFPSSSPASRSAAEARSAEVSRALREEPPLPGESIDGWSGLGSQAEPAADPHADHRHAAEPAADPHAHHRRAAEPEADPHANHRHAAPSSDPNAHDHASHGAPPPEATKDETPAAVEYTCPMHPDVVSDREGQCPRCGMKLVPKK